MHALNIILCLFYGRGTPRGARRSGEKNGPGRHLCSTSTTPSGRTCAPPPAPHPRRLEENASFRKCGRCSTESEASPLPLRTADGAPNDQKGTFLGHFARLVRATCSPPALRPSLNGTRTPKSAIYRRINQANMTPRNGDGAPVAPSQAPGHAPGGNPPQAVFPAPPQVRIGHPSPLSPTRRGRYGVRVDYAHPVPSKEPARACPPKKPPTSCAPAAAGHQAGAHPYPCGGGGVVGPRWGDHVPRARRSRGRAAGGPGPQPGARPDAPRPRQAPRPRYAVRGRGREPWVGFGDH